MSFAMDVSTVGVFIFYKVFSVSGIIRLLI